MYIPGLAQYAFVSAPLSSVWTGNIRIIFGDPYLQLTSRASLAQSALDPSYRHYERVCLSSYQQFACG